MKNWYKLNIDISSAIRPDFSFTDLVNLHAGSQNTNTALVWTWEGDSLHKVLTLQWLEYMSLIGLEVQLLEVFYRKPHLKETFAHVDISTESGEKLIIAVNWVVGEDNSQMTWFNIKNSKEVLHKLTPASVRANYTLHQFADLDEIERHQIGYTPTLVRVDIPHCVHLTGDTDRFAVSLRVNVRKIFGDKDPKWNEIVEYFKKYIV